MNMSCRQNEFAAMKFDFFLDRTPVCNPQFTHIDAEETDCAIQMEHSYSRDRRPTDKTMATRTILVHKPPPCPSCHSDVSQDQDVDMDEESLSLMPLPEVDDKAARLSMDHIANIASRTKNRNAEEDDWEERIDRTGWTIYQQNLFSKVAEILNLDRLARLAQSHNPATEPILRRATIDKAVSRMRKALAVVHWDLKLTQWLHGLLIDNLPVSFVAAYLDILQTLRSKVPSLVDKMTQGRASELMAAVTEPPWEPPIEIKDRKLNSEPILLFVPSTLSGVRDVRERHWISQFGTMSHLVRSILVPDNLIAENLHLSDCVESLVTLTRTKLHELRKEMGSQKPIILIGLNAGSSVALQVTSLETNSINCVICMGFATNTLRGTRGALDDRLVELQTPILFVIGQNSAKTSREQIEALREQMIAPTSLVVVGSANDSLQVPTAKRQLEQVTQAMVDSMVMDEVAEFTANCIANPPAAVQKRATNNNTTTSSSASATTASSESREKKITLVNGTGNSIIRKHKPEYPKATAITSGRVAKKKNTDGEASRRMGVAQKLTPAKKEFVDRVTMSQSATAAGNATNYEIVTGKLKQQIVDGSGFVQLETPVAQKYQITRTGGGAATASPTVILPVIQKQKISLGSQFTPMRTTGEQHVLLSAKQNATFLPKDVYTVNANGRKIYSLKTSNSSDVIETIELDTDEEILNIDGDTILNAQVVSADTEIDLTGTDLSSLPVVFQDSQGNIQESMEINGGGGSAGPIMISTTGTTSSLPSSGGIPRPNKYIYYKTPSTAAATTTITKSQSAPTTSQQFVVLSTTVDGSRPGGESVVSSKPIIISVESSLDNKDTTVYHVLSDSEEKAE